MQIETIDYKQKYLKYKAKYLELKDKIGSGKNNNFNNFNKISKWLKNKKKISILWNENIYNFCEECEEDENVFSFSNKSKQFIFIKINDKTIEYKTFDDDGWTILVDQDDKIINYIFTRFNYVENKQTKKLIFF